MPKCPKCGAEIDHLINWSEAEEKYVFRTDSKGLPVYEYLDSIPSVDGKNEYECPMCNEVLFTDEEDAVNFLREA